MSPAEAYVIIEKVKTTPEYTYYRASRTQDDLTVILKRARLQNQTDRLKAEFNLLKTVSHPNIANYLDFFTEDGFATVVIQECKGESLLDFFENHKCEFDQKAFIAEQICEAITAMHGCGIIHRAMSLEVILVDEQNRIKIVDFSHAATHDSANESLETVLANLPNLNYISPEQSGKMGKSVDYRTDFYSFGVILYKIFCDTFPFHEADDALLIHHHLAKLPTSPQHLKKRIPKPLSDCIMKLLEKNPEQRFKNGWEIKQTFEILKTHQKETSIQSDDDFSNTTSAKFSNYPDDLIGREKQIEDFIHSSRTAFQGGFEIISIVGSSGSGKSRFVNEIKKDLNKKGVLFLSGRYTQQKQMHSYQGIISVLKDFFQQVLALSDLHLVPLKKKFEEEIGHQFSLLSEYLPELELLFEVQTKTGEHEFYEFGEALKIAFLKLINLILRENTKLAIFLDDMQWCDKESIQLFLEIEPVLEQNLVIFAYRDDELKKGNSFAVFERYLQMTKRLKKKIKMTPLNYADLLTFFSFLKSENDTAISKLAQVARSISGGNPLYIREYFQSLKRAGVVKFNPASGWILSIENIDKINIYSNIQEVIKEKYLEFSAQSIHIIKVISCFSAGITRKVANVVTNFDAVSLDKALFELTENQVIERREDKFCFRHDKLHETAYEWILQGEKQKLHFEIGSGLFEAYRSGDIDNESIFDIARNLKCGFTSQTDFYYKESVIEFFILVGRKTRKISAYTTALSYIEFAKSSIEPNCLKLSRSIRFELYHLYAELEALTGNYKQALDTLNETQTWTTDLLDKYKLFKLKLNILTYLDLYAEVMGNLRSILREFAIDLPAESDELIQLIYKENETLHQNLEIKPIEQWGQLPVLKNEEQRAVLGLMVETIYAGYSTNIELTAFCILKGMNLIYRYGLSSEAILFITCCGIIWNIYYQDYDKAYKFGILAEKLKKDRFPSEAAAVANSGLAVFVYPWKTHLSSGIRLVEESIHRTIETGEIAAADISLNIYLRLLFYSGVPISEIINKKKQLQISFLKREPAESILSSQLTEISEVLCQTNEANGFKKVYFEDDVAFSKLVKNNNKNAIFRYLTVKLIVLYLQKNYSEANQACKLATNYLPYMPSVYDIVEFHFFESLVNSALLKQRAKQPQANDLQELQANIKRFQNWSHHCKENFEHKLYLIQALHYELTGDLQQSLEAYEKAIEGSEENGFLNIKAIALELLAECYYKSGRRLMAKVLFSRAITAFNEWGATAIAERIIKSVKNLFPAGNLHLDSHRSDLDRSTARKSQANLDLITIAKSSQAISQNLDYKSLISEMMKVFLESAAAEKGFFIRSDDDSLFVDASIDVNTKEVTFGPRALDTCSDILCANIVYYTWRTKKQIVLNDASNEGAFTSAEYILSNKPSSIICIPVESKNYLIGVLYLENNLTTHAFTRERLHSLNILTTQAAISIENSSLFEREKNYIEKLKEADKLKDDFLANTSHELRTPLAGIVGISESLYEKLEKNLDFKDKQDLLMITQSGKRLANLINDILDFSKLKTGEIRIEKKAIHLQSIVDLVLRQCFPLAERVRSQLINEVSASLPAVFADENRLTQILFNLVGNSIKYCVDGIVSVKAEHEDQFVRIIVEDNGIGISQEDQKRIFNAFERGDAGISKIEGGTGLGLTIAKQLVELQGGSIDFESTSGKTLFRFTIPVIAEEVQKPINLLNKKPEPIRHLLTPLDPVFRETELGEFPNQEQILIVDDDPVMLSVLNNYLINRKYKPVTAISGLEAIEILRSEPDISLAIVDVMMPVMNGYDLCRRLRAQYSRIELPVIFLTARSQNSDIIAGYEAGGNDYLIKPINKEELYSRVKAQLEIKKSYSHLQENQSLKRELKKKEEQELKSVLNQRQLTRILDSRQEAILVLNDADEIIYANKQMVVLLKEDDSKIFQRPISNFIDINMHDLRQSLASIRSTPPDHHVESEISLELMVIKTGRKLNAVVKCLFQENQDRLLITFWQQTQPDTVQNENEKLKELFKGLKKPLIEGDTEFFLETREIPQDFDKSELKAFEHDVNLEKRNLLVEIMSLALTCWEQAKGKSKIELAEESGVWRTYLDARGTYSTRTLDRYLKLSTLPKKPRWQNVLRTAYFVSTQCQNWNKKMIKQLDELTKRLEIILRSD